MKNPWRAVAVLACTFTIMPARAAGPAPGVAYVSNQNGDVSTIDLVTLETTGTIDLGGVSPRGLGLSGDGRWLVTANREDGSLSIVDRRTAQVVRRVAIGQNPEFVRVRGGLAFVTYEPSSTGGPPPQPGTEPSAHEENEKDEPAQIAVVDVAKGVVLRRIRGGLETEGIEFSADGRRLLVTNEADDTITIHDIATGALERTVSTLAYGKRPRGIKRSPDGRIYVVSLELGNQLLVLNARYEVVRTVPTGEFPYGLSFDRKGGRLFVAESRAKSLQVFDTTTWAPGPSAATGDRCWHFTFTPDDERLLVACGRSNEVVVLDAGTLQVIKRIADKQMPWGIVTWPKSMGSLDVP